MILITGATGFLGSELARQLAGSGQLIRCTKRTSSVIPSLLQPYAANIEWIDADMLDINALEDAMSGVSHVYNCAAWVSLKQADKEPMIRTNVAGAANVVNACLQCNARLLHVSSVAAIGEAKPGELITENHHMDESDIHDGYAISKLESEMEVWRGIAEGLNAVIVNPSIIMGPNAGSEGSGALYETVRKGLKFYTGGSIGFVDVQDVAAAMIALMDSDICGQRFIISAENWSYKAMVTAIAKCLELKPPVKLARPWMMSLTWRIASLLSIFTGKPPFIDKVSAQAASVERSFDNSKLVKAIGYKYKPVIQTVAETCAVFKA